MNPDKEKQILNEMIEFKKELAKKLQEAGSLKAVRNWSFEQREAGRNVPYMSGDNYSLFASPTTTQKELKEFFAIKAPNSVLPKYTLRIENDKVQLQKRLGKGADNCIVIDFLNE